MAPIVTGMNKTIALLCVALLAVAGCTSTTSTAQPNSAPSSSGAVNAGGIWREFVACARANGQQNMPDAVVDQAGVASFPRVAGFDQKTAMEAVRQPCGPILDRLPAGANPLARPSMSAQDLETMRRYVQCLRQNGMPDEPDPGPNGELNDPPKYHQPPLVDAYNQARTACDPILLGR